MCVHEWAQGRENGRERGFQSKLFFSLQAKTAKDMNISCWRVKVKAQLP